MAGVTMTNDPHWPSAASLVHDRLVADRRNVGLLGVFTYTTSVTARSWHSTPDAIREALDDRGGRMFVCSDTDHCAKRRIDPEIVAAASQEEPA